jgi:hypothetical protein
VIDFYRLSDGDPMPDDPDETAYLGSISLDEAALLTCVWKECTEFVDVNLHRDVVWRSADIGILMAHAERCLSTANPRQAGVLKRFLDMLRDSADHAGMGIVSFAD